MVPALPVLAVGIFIAMLHSLSPLHALARHQSQIDVSHWSISTSQAPITIEEYL
jgi:hypothetical protein